METTVKLKGVEYPLTLPRSHAVRLDIVGGITENFRRAYAAALALCLPASDAAKLRVDYARAGHNVGRFGGQVIDAMLAFGVPMDEILTAGSIAWSLVNDSLLTADEVEDARKN